MEENFLNDSDTEIGEYIFTIKKCPKTYKEAVIMQAQHLDSVIKEETEEHLSTSECGNMSDNDKNI